MRLRSQGFAYTPIVASGASACVLHYIENNAQCKDGEVILLDVGAEYANYASDLNLALRRENEKIHQHCSEHTADNVPTVPGSTFITEKNEIQKY